MEFIHGAKASDVKAIRAMQLRPSDVAALVVTAFSDMMFQSPFLHVDPHPGNLLVRPIPGTSNPQLVLLDHGMYNYVDERFTSFLQELWLGMVSQDAKRVGELCRPYGMEKYAQLLSLSMTVRSMNAYNKYDYSNVTSRYGEEMDIELRDSVEERVASTMRMMSMELFSKRISIVADMMNAMPRDFMYVFRVIEMVWADSLVFTR